MNPRNRDRKFLGITLKSKNWAWVVILLQLALIAGLLGFWHKQRVVQAEASGKFNLIYTPSQTFISKPTSEQTEIANFIRGTFGKDSDKAFLLLSCENKGLVPNAIHDNELWGQGKGKDYGIFQINNFWQQVQGKFLLDWKTNILIAHKIYVDSGYNFHLWTCGRNLGI